jgi:glycosyltransferase involved in cell wall biosynthesis
MKAVESSLSYRSARAAFRWLARCAAGSTTARDSEVKSLRVLHVIGGDDTGGAMSYLLPLLAALRAQGCDAHLLCLGGGGLADAAASRDLPHTVIPMSHPWDARAMAPIRRRLSGEAWQVVHTHGMRANLPVRLVLPTIPRRPLLFTTVHSDPALDYSSPLKSRGYSMMDRATRPLVAGFCCVSAPLARKLVERGIPESRVHVVHPGIEGVSGGTAGPPATVGEAAAPPKRGAPTDEPTVGAVARLVPVKDLGLLLDAIALVAQNVPRVRALIVGDGPERAALERRAAEKDLEGRVEFLGQVVPARPVLARFDVFALSSESEGIPISALEAMDAGLPVVATAVGGLPETVQDGVTGFLVKRAQDRTATAAALAGHLAELLLDPVARQRMGEAGKRRVAEHFSSEAAGHTMLNIYARELATLRSSRGRG